VKVYKVWGVTRRSDGARLTAVVMADSVAEALDRIKMNPAVGGTYIHTDESHSIDLSVPPHWVMVETDCDHSAHAEITGGSMATMADVSQSIAQLNESVTANKTAIDNAIARVNASIAAGHNDPRSLDTVVANLRKLKTDEDAVSTEAAAELP
jgi:hypothetical protein